MIAGHFGFAAGVKAAEQQTPLWALMLGAVWLDIVFVPLFLTGIEALEPVAGLAGHLDARGRQDHGEAGPHQLLVVGDHDSGHPDTRP